MSANHPSKSNDLRIEEWLAQVWMPRVRLIEIVVEFFYFLKCCSKEKFVVVDSGRFLLVYIIHLVARNSAMCVKLFEFIHYQRIIFRPKVCISLNTFFETDDFGHDIRLSSLVAEFQ